MKNYKILDCTLRDGGYYTDWKFDSSLVRELVKALDNNCVDIIELGYKSPIKGGPYRKCNDGFINSIIDFKVKAELAFMIDVKDYIIDKKVNKSLLLDIIKPSSTFTICRVAAKIDELPYIEEIVNILKELNYKVICNLMGTSLLKDKDFSLFSKICNKLDLEAVYIADSYGALFPEDIRNIFSSHPISGIHTHDNMGLAFANCLEAINLGADYIDGTITGMGRGVGNVRTEQLLLNRGGINYDLLNIVDKFNVLKNKFGWGTNPLYHRAGKEHIHPLFMQDLNSSSLNNKQLLHTLDALSQNTSYDPNVLNQLKKQRTVIVIPARYKSSRFPGKPLAKINGREMVLIVADKASEAIGKENVYIATENMEIVKIAKNEGYNVVITSDSCLTGTDRVAEASLEIDADIFINIQGDEPLIDPNDIKKSIDLKKLYPDYVINCMSKLHKDEEASNKKIPKVICDLDQNLIYCSRNVIPGFKEKNTSDIFKQVCIYVFDKNQLRKFHSTKKSPLELSEDIEIVRCLEKGMKVKMLKVDKVSYAVDYPEDIKVIEENLNGK
jgi:3-deoxy-manno-octulosonate cytidylyltransferase (CMP-KDO synthetase)